MYIQKDKHCLTVMFIQVCFVHKKDFFIASQIMCN